MQEIKLSRLKMNIEEIELELEKIINEYKDTLYATQNNTLGSLLLAIYGYFAQTEREIISERTKQGLATNW